MLMNTLDRYIGKSILGAIFATLFTLVGLSAIIKFVEQFRSVGKGSYDIWQAVAYTGLTMPKDVETFFPMAALLGALNHRTEHEYAYHEQTVQFVESPTHQ